MKKINTESLIGILILIFCLGSVAYLFKTIETNTSANIKYNVFSARFNNLDGVTKGTDVKIAGVKVGYVRDITLDKTSFQAIVVLKIDNTLQIPQDSILAVSTTGLIGSKYLEIKAGFEDHSLQNKDFFTTTQSSQNIEDLVSKFVAK
jgi:phospholipid/cholesterol/gamma-HCH transport system substrate-binding protein